MGASPRGLLWLEPRAAQTEDTDAKGQAEDRPASGSARHPQERSPGSQKPQLTSGYLGLSNFKIRKPSESGQSKKEPSELARMPKFASTKPYHASGHRDQPYPSAGLPFREGEEQILMKLRVLKCL